MCTVLLLVLSIFLLQLDLWLLLVLLWIWLLLPLAPWLLLVLLRLWLLLLLISLLLLVLLWLWLLLLLSLVTITKTSVVGVVVIAAKCYCFFCQCVALLLKFCYRGCCYCCCPRFNFVFFLRFAFAKMFHSAVNEILLIIDKNVTVKQGRTEIFILPIHCTPVKNMFWRGMYLINNYIKGIQRQVRYRWNQVTYKKVWRDNLITTRC